MSELKEHLLAQDTEEKDVGAAFKKMFGDIPVIDATAERERFLKANKTLVEALNAESKK